jgi:NAD(P)H-quinone oxidoreductase subunit 6
MNRLSVPDLVFYGTALATVLSAGYAVFTRNIVRAVFSLLGTFFGVAVIYGLLAADFIAVVQLMVYVGGILVLMLFAVMLTSQIDHVERSNRAGSWPVGLGIGLAVFVLLAGIALEAPWKQAVSLDSAPTTAGLGEILAGPMLMPFAFVSLVLLGVVIGSVTLARRKSASEVH